MAGCGRAVVPTEFQRAIAPNVSPSDRRECRVTEVSALLPSDYVLRRGSPLDRALLLKGLQRTYRELFPDTQSLGQLAQTVDAHLSPQTPLWWVDRAGGGEAIAAADRAARLPRQPPASADPVAGLWLGNAVDQASGDRYAHVFWLYVVPACRRQGLAKALLRVAEDWARQRGDRQMGLQVYAHNQPAIALYRQMGYQTQSLSLQKSLRSD